MVSCSKREHPYITSYRREYYVTFPHTFYIFTSISGRLAPIWKAFKCEVKKKYARCAHCRAESFFSVWSTSNRTVPSGMKPSRDEHRRRYLRLLTGIFGNLARATGEVTTWERLRYLQLPRGPDCLTAPPETGKFRFQYQKAIEFTATDS